MADNDSKQKITVSTEQNTESTHVEVDIPAASKSSKEEERKQREQERRKRQEEREKRQKEREKRQKEREEKKKEEEEKKKNDEPFTIAGYTLGELAKAPVEPPNPREVGKRSPRSK